MRRVVDEERFVVGTRSRAKMVEHKWGTSTKEGDAFPNVPVDIGFAGLDPTNRKMSGDLNKGKGAASEKSPTCACARTCAMEPAGRPRAAALGRPWNATRVACGGPQAWASGVSALSCFPRRSEDALGDAPWRLHAHLIHVPGAHPAALFEPAATLSTTLSATLSATLSKPASPPPPPGLSLDRLSLTPTMIMPTDLHVPDPWPQESRDRRQA